MNKNIILVIVGIAIIGLGTSFYIKQPRVDNSNVSTPTFTNTPADIATSSTTVSDQNNGSIKSFTVTGTNFSFSPSEMRVKKGDTVRITLKSTTGMHDLRIDEFGVGTKVLRASDSSETIEFVANKAGTFEYYCSVGNHRAMGMRGNLIVTE